jgi:hypothetical protein
MAEVPKGDTGRAVQFLDTIMRNMHRTFVQISFTRFMMTNQQCSSTRG